MVPCTEEGSNNGCVVRKLDVLIKKKLIESRTKILHTSLFYIYFYINSIFCFFFLIFDRSFELSLGPVQKNYLRSMQCLHVASTGILEFISYATIYRFCTVHIVARYYLTSILVQCLRNFVPRERVFCGITDLVTNRISLPSVQNIPRISDV